MRQVTFKGHSNNGTEVTLIADKIERYEEIVTGVERLTKIIMDSQHSIIVSDPPINVKQKLNALKERQASEYQVIASVLSDIIVWNDGLGIEAKKDLLDRLTLNFDYEIL